MRTLAAIHNAAEFQPALPWPKLLELFDRQSDPLDAQLGSRSARRRAARLAYIVEGAWRTRDARVISEAAGIEQPLACEAISLIQSLAPRELDKALHWQSASLPLQRRLGDVHHDHVLFTGDEVTGVVDFGAADYDSPAGDVGRLLGSLVNEDRDGWRRGLDAYCAVHPLTPDELSAADFFDTSGTVISVANWLQWLWGEPDKRLKLSDYTRPLARLNRLVDRLRSLVARGD
jgi:Ser/Thr protein kinase RdoA (MazF antagonist)